MLKGIHLTLMMGPAVLVPAPSLVMDALDSVEVTTASGSASGFQLSFQFNSRSALNQILLIAGVQAASAYTPPLRVLMFVTMNGTAQPLFDGVMTHIAVQPGANGSSGTLSMTGEDLTRMMDNYDWSGLPYAAMSIEARVALICAKYASFGIVPLPVSAIYPDTPIPAEKIPAHNGTDLEYLQELAHLCGYVFYIEPGPAPGTSVAYFGPEIKVGVPQPALNVDMDAYTNVESLSFNFDSTRGVLPIVYVQLPVAHVPALPIPIPASNPLQPPLGLLPSPLTRVSLLKDTAKLKPLEALKRGVAEAARSQDAVSANGELDVLRYGRMLKARQLVGVRGAGLAYDGLYYVQSVKSTLKRGQFKQSFQLSRNGLISITPRVPA
ncbi:MAG: hypothetical protein JWQ90_3002 [Hydrocarboniphaga sp.]|uniref:hypothetical protein n=1 Tax=Hydrocarboniphaga sp. TaxID=2033016 RepID=UPI00261D60A8|nr:hypothetical protein [Hydrocarboniphaga sp.]MDB5970552.1 hypothetical protein [Hydrocarboniphaga sp.]